MTIVAIMNGRAGSLLGGSEEEGVARVRDAFRRCGCEVEVRAAAPDAIPGAVQDAVQRGARTVAVAGGDGTLQAAARRLVGGGAALAVLPLGTFNHFAKDLGVPLDLAAAARLAATGTATTIDVAEVNGRLFINHAALGIYPEMVRRRDKLRRRFRLRKRLATVVASLAALHAYSILGYRIRIGDAAHERRSPFLFIGHNRYILDAYGLVGHEGRDKLALAVAHEVGRLRLVWMALKALAGRLGSTAYDVLLFEGAIIESRHRRRLLVELDGELAQLATPLVFRLRPRALRVVAPPEFSGGRDVGGAEEHVMDWDRLAGNWKQFKGRLRERWGELTDDELNVIGGRREQLVGRLQERYNISAEEAERQLGEFEASERARDG